METNLQ